MIFKIAVVAVGLVALAGCAPETKCADPTNWAYAKILEQEYTGEKPKGSAEALCLKLREMFRREEEIERKRAEYRSGKR